ncbi:DUF3408 domain-containing protein [Elizabethkingia anophelis]|uniref:Conjugative transposon protein TraB n=2 Tax=Elizabethkingia anophelis TaxID=1117645 RepID=A0A455ZF73_9FLAO|nr:DUF3408 domain-containing protein [Elizabethkingia anophelis]AIL46958.1 Conjugative transposon protein TraB [Elizabethkingia anophelis NUHP1]DAC75410.1 TPA_exp: conjugative transposon protein TraB [Elizabethkingia anophelis]
MEKENKRKVTPDINEEMMMNLMVDGVKKEGIQLPQEPPPEQDKKEVTNNALSKHKNAHRERNKLKKFLDTSYGEHFLQTHSMPKRGDKSIYIRQEYHERLSRIVQVIGNDEIPLYAYLDNILAHHFELFEKEITDDFDAKYKPLF